MAGVFSFRALYQAYIACRVGKRGSRSAQRYDLRLLDNLIDTATALQRNAWRPSRSVCFVSRQAKPREVHAAEFSDRVVHHLLVPRLEALYEPVFIHDSDSNRVGKGTHAAVDRRQTFMRQVSRNGQRPAWYLQLDIASFFPRIDRRILYRLLQRRLAKAVAREQLTRAEALQLTDLCRVILSAEPGRDGRRLSQPGAQAARAAPGPLCQDSCRLTQIPYSVRGQQGEQDDDLS